MSDQETEKKKAIERANSYREMMQMWAWKDFVKLAESQKESYGNIIDVVSFEIDNAPMIMAESRGARKAIGQLLNSVDFIVSTDI